MSGSRGYALEIDPRARIAVLRLSRPPLNVIGIELMEALAREVRALAERAEHRVLAIAGEGRAFSAGADIAEHVGRPAVERMLRALHDLVRALDAHPRPVVALVRGAALGGGLELALACDLIWAGSAATFGTPEVKLGVFAPAATALLPRRIGLGRALELLLSGEAITANEAHAMGLVDRVLEDGRFDELARASLERLASRSGPALGLARRAAHAAIAARDLGEALDRVERLYLDEVLPLADAAEGLKAFLEKRAPQWRDA